MTAQDGRRASNAERLGERIRDVAPSVLLTLAGFLVFVSLWELVAQLGFFPRLILPAASDVLQGLHTLAVASWFPAHVQATALEMFLGFSLGAMLAVTSASVLYELPRFRRAVYPYIIFFQLTPAIVLAPVFIIWFGFGLESKVVVSIATSFFVILIATLAGFDSVDESAGDLMRSLKASRWQIYSMLTFRAALPSIFAGLRTATTLALIGALVAEFITAQVGLGTLLTQFSFGLQQNLVFATVVVIAALGIVFYAIIELIQRKVVWWRY
jgi:NitT/TauT family transport system permease protein